MELWRGFLSFLMKDVKNDNETKKASVLMRVYSLVMCVFFVIQFFLLIGNSRYHQLYLPAIGIVGYVVAFILTYYGKTRVARDIILFYTVGWMVLYVCTLGWNCGFQNFCFVLLVFLFMTGYTSIPVKCVGAALLGAVRIGLYFYCQNFVPLKLIPRREMQQFQVLNTIIEFALLIFLVALFSLDSLESEKKLIAYNDRMKQMAAIDPLTGLSNRRGMEEYIASQIKDPTGNEGFINFAIGDIDFFKKVNDTYGHAAGDDLLKQLAAIFQEFMLTKGRVARWGGEEFLFVFLGVNGDQSKIDLEELRRRVEKTTFHSGEQELHVTMTFGMEEYSYGDSYETSISEADEKLYRGKESGRNQVVF